MCGTHAVNQQKAESSYGEVKQGPGHFELQGVAETIRFKQ